MVRRYLTANKVSVSERLVCRCLAGFCSVTAPKHAGSRPNDVPSIMSTSTCAAKTVAVSTRARPRRRRTYLEFSTKNCDVPNNDDNRFLLKNVLSALARHTHTTPLVVL